VENTGVSGMERGFSGCLGDFSPSALILSPPKQRGQKARM